MTDWAKLIGGLRVLRKVPRFWFISADRHWPELQRVQRDACRRSLENGLSGRERGARNAEASIWATIMLRVSDRYGAASHKAPWP